MKIILNGNSEEVLNGISLASLLEELGLDRSVTVAELNGNVIKKEEYDNTILNDNDILELISFVGGG